MQVWTLARTLRQGALQPWRRQRKGRHRVAQGHGSNGVTGVGQHSSSPQQRHLCPVLSLLYMSHLLSQLLCCAPSS